MMRRFFIRRTRQYVCWFLIPVICAFLFFGTMMVRQEARALKKQGENSLEAVNSQLDLVVNSVMEQQNQIANGANMMVALSKMLSRKNEISFSEAIYLRSINTFLSSVVRAHNYISSIYLYFDGYDSYFSSEGNRIVIKEEDKSWLSAYEEMPKEMEGFALLRTLPENPAVDMESEQVLTVYRRMLIRDGVIVVNLNLRKLQESLDKMSGGNFESLYLFDGNGNLVTADLPDGEIKKMLPKERMQLLSDGQQKDAWKKIGGKRYLFQADFYDLYQLYLLSLIPQSALLSRLGSLFGIFALFFLLDFIIAVWISYVTTKRNFNQIDYTLKLFEQAEAGVFPEKKEKSPEDEYGVIMNNILHMFLNTTYLNTQLAEKQYRQQVMELSTLQYQINPHFLFNTLQTVDLEVRKLSGNTQRVTQILSDLSDLLKYSLGNPTETVALREELLYLKEYVEIQQYRLREEFIVYYEVEEEWMDARVPRLLLQPLLENSILHGIRESTRKGYIKVRIYPWKGRMHFVVIDNGVGMTADELTGLKERIRDENSKNIGLTNVNRRLMLRYGEESTLKIQSKKGWGCCISFWIPLVHIEEKDGENACFHGQNN